jgi:large subunit ribosomal protein L6
MSRIGIKPITLPAGVEVSVDEKNVVTVKGPKGELQEKISSLLTIEINDGVVTVSRDSDAAEKRAQHGLARTLINNMVVGVTEVMLRSFSW